MKKPQSSNAYWKHNLFVVSLLLVVWFVIGYAASIFGIEALNAYQVGQIGLGFWMAQQGSIFGFVIIVLVYAIWMDRVDHKYGAGDDR